KLLFNFVYLNDSLDLQILKYIQSPSYYPKRAYSIQIIFYFFISDQLIFIYYLQIKESLEISLHFNLLIYQVISKILSLIYFLQLNFSKYSLGKISILKAIFSKLILLDIFTILFFIFSTFIFSKELYYFLISPFLNVSFNISQ
ncbi:hypothetical protein IMG5_050110, partial [Ichthyophthirius multifiliis]